MIYDTESISGRHWVSLREISSRDLRYSESERIETDSFANFLKESEDLPLGSIFISDIGVVLKFFWISSSFIDSERLEDARTHRSLISDRESRTTINKGYSIFWDGHSPRFLDLEGETRVDSRDIMESRGIPSLGGVGAISYKRRSRKYYDDRDTDEEFYECKSGAR